MLAGAGLQRGTVLTPTTVRVGGADRQPTSAAAPPCQQPPCVFSGHHQCVATATAAQPGELGGMVPPPRARSCRQLLGVATPPPRHTPLAPTRRSWQAHVRAPRRRARATPNGTPVASGVMRECSGLLGLRTNDVGRRVRVCARAGDTVSRHFAASLLAPRTCTVRHLTFAAAASSTAPARRVALGTPRHAYGSTCHTHTHTCARTLTAGPQGCRQHLFFAGQPPCCSSPAPAPTAAVALRG